MWCAGWEVKSSAARTDWPVAMVLASATDSWKQILFLALLRNASAIARGNCPSYWCAK
ncbi:Uncharacterised protein [Mycobacteroides abscessus subsp. abscessus]|nr:Uncharacterised protein [Mycobacteroides abscessus subsp. abscessus]